jgi:hypothetical protein
MEPEVQKAAEAAYNLLFRWNDDDAWNDGDQLLLREDKMDEPDFQRVDDMMRIRTDDEPYPGWVYNAIGLTAQPAFQDDDD